MAELQSPKIPLRAVWSSCGVLCTTQCVDLIPEHADLAPAGISFKLIQFKR